MMNFEFKPVSVHCGCSHSIILTKLGWVFTFGSNKFGECGNENFSNKPLPDKPLIIKMKNMKNGKPDQITSISTFNFHNIFLTKSGAVYSNGGNGVFQTGIITGGEGKNITKISRVTNLKQKIKSVHAGGSHSMFISQPDGYCPDPQIYACGDNLFGQLGLRDYKNRKHPTLLQVDFRKWIKDIQLGFAHSLFLTTKGKLYSCGKNNVGQLAHNSDKKRKCDATLVKFKGNIKKIFSGHDHNFIICNIGNVYGFGSNKYGELGIDDDIKEYRTQPTLVIALRNIKIKKIFCGENYTFFLSQKDTLYACGKNNLGQLSLGNNHTPQPNDSANDDIIRVPVEIFTYNYKIRHIACGQSHNIILTHNNALFANGSNAYQQLGISKKNNAHKKQYYNHWMGLSIKSNNDVRVKKYHDIMKNRRIGYKGLSGEYDGSSNGTRWNSKIFYDYVMKNDKIYEDIYEKIKSASDERKSIMKMLSSGNFGNGSDVKEMSEMDSKREMLESKMEISNIEKVKRSNMKMMSKLADMEKVMHQKVLELSNVKKNFLQEQKNILKKIKDEHNNSSNTSSTSNEHAMEGVLKIMENSRKNREDLGNDINTMKVRVNALEESYANSISSGLSKIKEENNMYLNSTLPKLLYKKFNKKRKKEEEEFLSSLKDIKDEKILFLNQLIGIEKDEFEKRLRGLNKDKEELRKTLPKIVLKKVIKRVRKEMRSEIEKYFVERKEREEKEEEDKLKVLLKEHKLEKYHEGFINEEILYEDIEDLNDENLKPIFKDKTIHMNRFLRAVQKELEKNKNYANDTTLNETLTLNEKSTILLDDSKSFIVENDENNKSNVDDVVKKERDSSDEWVNEIK